MKMKKAVKKLITLTLSIALAASSLTGCGLFMTGNTGPSSVDIIKGADDTAADNGDDSSKGGYVGPETDTVQWFNATYAIITDLNGQDYNMFGGAKPNEMNKMQYKAMLDSSWGVTDRASADETLDWILTEGHRDDFKTTGDFLSAMVDVEELEETDFVDFLMQEWDESKEEAEFDFAAYQMYKEYGETAIDAWDYCRALSLMSFYYMAGYYTKEEALDKSLEIAETLQPMYDSWDELIDSYLRGYEYWAQEDSSERREIYEELLDADDNPFRVDYNITLEKTW